MPKCSIQSTQGGTGRLRAIVLVAYTALQCGFVVPCFMLGHSR
jgi:hypothetical protein